MPNAIKYSTSAQTLALKKGNFWIGTGDVGKGPTSTTDYYNGITPPSGGYTIYLNKASGGPSIYTAANDSQLISLSNTIAGQTFASAAAALAWFATQADKMVFNIDYPAIVTDGLVLFLDAKFASSYPSSGTTCYDLTSSPSNFSLINGLSVVNDYFSFDGTDDSLYGFPVPSKLQFTSTSQFTFIFGARPINVGGPLFRVGDSAYGFYPREGSMTFHSLGTGPAGWGNSTSVSLSNLTMDNNHFIACRVNNRSFDAFVDGTFSSTSTIPEQSASAYGFMSFFNTISNGGEKLSGRLYFAYAYNRILSNAEITATYNSQKTRLGL